MHRGEGECLEYGSHSTEAQSHADRIKKKINCQYSRDYQIPDQPRICQLNKKTFDPKKLVVIKLPEDAFKESKKASQEDSDTSWNDEELSIDLSKESAVKEQGAKKRHRRQRHGDLDEIEMKNLLQIDREPRFGILKQTKTTNESNTEITRWQNLKRLTTFFALNEETCNDFISEVST